MLFQSTGISHGGGQTRPMVLRHSPLDDEILSGLLKHPSFVRMAGHASGRQSELHRTSYANTYFSGQIYLPLGHLGSTPTTPTTYSSSWTTMTPSRVTLKTASLPGAPSTLGRKLYAIDIAITPTYHLAGVLSQRSVTTTTKRAATWSSGTLGWSLNFPLDPPSLSPRPR